jgi:hypothetical protein
MRWLLMHGVGWKSLTAAATSTRPQRTVLNLPLNLESNISRPAARLLPHFNNRPMAEHPEILPQPRIQYFRPRAPRRYDNQQD